MGAGTQAAVRAAGGDASVVIDSDDHVARPEATMTAYCAAVGLPQIPQALTWQPGERSEWHRSARWHVDVSASSGFERHVRIYPHTVENSRDLARFAAHQPAVLRAALRTAAGRYAVGATGEFLAGGRAPVSPPSRTRHPSLPMPD
jgi:hypothetical protein